MKFFEITRYNSQQIKLIKESIDLSYMLIQLSDELSPVFSQRGLSIKLEIDEDLTVCADADQLARVLSNILKNAAAYSYLNTEIRISTEKVRGHVFVIFQNKGNTIPAEKLSSLFDKFYRLDESRASDTGGTGLGWQLQRKSFFYMAVRSMHRAKMTRSHLRFNCLRQIQKTSILPQVFLKKQTTEYSNLPRSCSVQ